MNILKNQQGIALITVLLFSMVAFGVVTGAYYMVTSHSKISGMNKRYMSEIEVARGIAEYVVGELKNGTATCNTGSPCCSATSCKDGLSSSGICQPGKTIDIHGAVCTALGRTSAGNSCDNVTACMMSKNDYTEINPNKFGADKSVKVSVYSINVQSKKPSGEKANIDFVVRM